MKLNKKLWAGLTMALALPAISLATTQYPANQLVSKLARNQVNIVKSFSSVGNLEGFIVEPLKGPKQQSIVYADKDGRYMMVGTVVDSSGSNVTQSDFNTYIASGQGPKVFAAAQKTNWVQDGKDTAPHKAYIMIEPNCIACHMMYKDVAPLIASGQLSVRWILVSFMKPFSDGMNAAIMTAKDPGAAVAMDEKNFDVKTETGGIKPMPTVSDDMKTKLKQNMSFMMDNGFVGTPGLIYKTTSGQYQVVRGYLNGAELKKSVDTMSNQF